MVATCTAIVSTVVGLDVEDADRSRTWKGDAAECLKRGSVETARAIYAHALGVFPGKKSIWRAAAQLEKDHGTPAALDALLARAVTYCPQVRTPDMHVLSVTHFQLVTRQLAAAWSVCKGSHEMGCTWRSS